MKMKQWTVQISVSENWIDDGFNLTDENLKDVLLNHCLAYATDSELKVKIVETKEVA